MTNSCLSTVPYLIEGLNKFVRLRIRVFIRQLIVIFYFYDPLCYFSKNGTIHSLCFLTIIYSRRFVLTRRALSMDVEAAEPIKGNIPVTPAARAMLTCAAEQVWERTQNILMPYLNSCAFSCQVTQNSSHPLKRSYRQIVLNR